MDGIETTFQDYTISSDKCLLQLDKIHHFLSVEAYWSKNIPKEVVTKAIENSFCVGIYLDGGQVGFCRIITDYSTFGYLADVYVLEAHRGKGLSKAMMAAIMELSWVNKLRRFTLATLDAHGLYKQFGFDQPKYPERLMEITKPNIYGDGNNPCT
ncbi:MAG: family N-acetyltransferase [Sphingobacteriaceae bacterium]|jgi:GNAT superfamily N-acetyltransferase|nr:family N-acetyltransferase [Sphingobacteriaceae bacterium]